MGTTWFPRENSLSTEKYSVLSYASGAGMKAGE
jgi:hypothetical protein